MNVLSLFSGVGGFDLGLERAGMTTVAQCEWDTKCQQVLARHWPDVPRWGDVSDVNGSDLPDCDLVAFGSPCQDLSVAGKRAGMVEGETRSGLFYEAIRIIKELQDERRGPAWVVWENVVGALSSNGGRDFGAVLDSLADIGAVDIQWRVLDAQWFGVPQRRRRVFVVARLDSGAAGGPQVLPVGASVRRDSAPGSETGQEVAGTLEGGTPGGGTRPDTDRMTFVPVLTGTVTTTWAKGPGNTQVEEGHVIPVAVAENQRGDVYTSDVSPSVSSGGGKPGQGYPAVLAFDSTFSGQSNVFEDMMPPVKVGSGAGIASPPAVMEGGSLAVRRLTPRECERQRLMGWPDDWTRWTADGTEIADSHRYRMCGNGVASPVADWVGRCILKAAS